MNNPKNMDANRALVLVILSCFEPIRTKIELISPNIDVGIAPQKNANAAPRQLYP